MEFYEPMLYMSTPEHPNTMGVALTLTEPVDGDILRSAVGDLRSRFPYFYVRAASCGNDLVPVSNPLPMTVRNTWDPVNFNSESSNYHLAAFKYEGKRLAFEISHALTDGVGVLPYIKSVMFLYLSRKTGEIFDSAGFRLPGDVIPESETGDPFAGLDIDGVEKPLYTKKPVTEFFRLNTSGQKDQHIFCLKFREDQLMKYCRENDGSPNVFFSVMLAKAVRRYDPDSEKTIVVSVAIDHKAMLGNTDNYRQFANVAELDFPKSRSLDDVMKACTIARGQLMLQAQPENSMWAIKRIKDIKEKLDPLPLDMKLGAMAKSAGNPRWSIAVSYANSRSFGPLDPYIEELYVLSEPGVTDVICEIACINHSFFIGMAQTFSSGEYFECLMEELKAAGIECEVMMSEPLRLCGIERF